MTLPHISVGKLKLARAGEGMSSVTSVSAAPTRAVERALALLAAVSAAEPLSLAECARRTRLAPSTALRLLRTLERAAFVRRDDGGHFHSGARLIQLGAAALGRQAIVARGEPALRRIVAATGESAYLSIAGPEDTAIYVAMVEGTHAVRHTSWVGRAFPMDGLAVGDALRGDVPDAGYVAQRDRQEPDVTAIAAPIRRPGGVAGALSLIGPTYRIDDRTMHEYGQIVSREAEALADQLGASQWGATEEAR
jgi:IclR family transcriptional regulator, acetate operon repressor